jgi:hypothetical protein
VCGQPVRDEDYGQDAADDHQTGADQHGVAVDRVQIVPVREAAGADPGRERQHRDRQQPRRAGDRVVDAAGDAGVRVVQGAECGRGQRRDQCRQAQPKDDHRGQDVRQVRGVRADEGEQHQRDRAHEGSDRHRYPRADPLAELPGPGGEEQHDHGYRQQRDAAGQRAVAGHHLQVEDDQEEHAAGGRVDDECHEVGAREGPRRKDVERQHRMPRAALDHHERRHAGNADGERDQHLRTAGAVRGPGREAVGEATERDRAGQHAGDVKLLGRRGVARLGHVPGGDREDDQGQRYVDQEDKPPTPDLDEPPAEKRPERAADATQAGPRPDRPGPVFGGEGRLENGERARGE